MANFTRNFVLGKMNKTFDERVVPEGEYIDAMNVRMGSTEKSEVGVIENTKGNLPLTTLTYTDGTPLSTEARCIDNDSHNFIVTEGSDIIKPGVVVYSSYANYARNVVVLRGMRGGIIAKADFNEISTS